MAKYYIGETVFNNKLTELNLTFPELINKLSIHKTLNISKEDYFKLPATKAEADKKGLQWRGKAKDTRYITPCSFDPAIRLSDNAKEVNLICLDVDDSKDAGVFVNPDDGAETMASLLGNLNFFAHTTATSTEKKPKFHIFIEAEDISIEGYSRAVKHVASLLGVTVDAASYKVTQPMFWPSMFKDEKASSFIGSRINGIPLTSEVIPPEEGEEVESIPEIPQIQLPVGGITVDVAKEILKKVKNDTPYAQWIKVAAALKHQFGENPDVGFDIFAEWSKRDYPGWSYDECKVKWDSFSPDAKSGNSVTIRTLMHYAEKRGWRGLPKVVKDAYSEIQIWMNSLTTDHAEIMSVSMFLKEVFNKMLRIPKRDKVEENIILSSIKTTIARVFKSSYPIGDVRIQWRTTLKDHYQKSSSKPPPKSFNGWVYMAYGKTELFYNLFDRREVYPIGFNRIHGNDLNLWIQRLAQVESGEWWLINTEGEKVSSNWLKNPSDFCLNYIKIPIVNGREYAPDAPDDSIVEQEGVHYINVYIDGRPPEDPSTSEKAGEILVGHLKRIIKERSCRNHFMDFLAYTVQNPGEKIRHAIYLQSFYGIGKNWMAEMMEQVLGCDNVMIDKINPLTNFDSWKSENQLVFFDDFDLPYSKNGKRDAVDRLKGPIANSTISVERKFQERITGMRNVTNYIFFTNRSDALFITAGDRRYYCIQSTIQNKDDWKKEFTSGYFDKLFKDIYKFPGGFRHFLLNYKISDTFRPHAPAPSTSYRRSLEEGNKPELEILIEDSFEENLGLLQQEFLSSKTLMNWIEFEGHTNYSSQYVARILRDMGYVKLGRFRIKNELHYLWKHRSYKIVGSPKIEALRRLKEDEIL